MSVKSLNELELSGRTKNALFRLGIHTLEDLRAVSLEELEQQRQLGLFTMSEIRRVLSEDGAPVFNTDETDVSKKDPCLKEHKKEKEKEKNAEERTYSAEQLAEMKLFPVTELILSQRATRALIAAKYETMDCIATLSAEEIHQLKGLGAKAVEEVITKRDEWLMDNDFIQVTGSQAASAISEETEHLMRHLAGVITPIVPVFWNKLYKMLSDDQLLEQLNSDTGPDATIENFKTIFSRPQFIACLKRFWEKWMPDGIMRTGNCMQLLKVLDLKIPLQELIDVSIQTKTIFLHRDHYLLERERFVDLYSRLGLPDERINAIIRMKLAGASLQKTGDFFGLTRERVRQIVRRQIQKLPELQEDCFAQPYETFHLSKDEFLRLFPELTDESYEYLSISYKKGKQPFSLGALARYNGYWGNHMEQFLLRELKQREKETINKTEIIYRVLARNADNPLTMEEFEQEYYRYIRYKEYPESRLQLNLRTVGNYLRRAQKIVFNRDNKVRYCEADTEKIWDSIDFHAYKNLIISSELLFRDYADLMEEQDVRDGYELFYVLKSSISLWKGDSPISFRRVPTMIIGNGSEEEQALRLLHEISPIGHDEYYLAYEERFGVRHDTISANPVVTKVITPYYVHGEYVITAPAIAEEDVQAFLHALEQKTIWFMEELEELFDTICVHSSKDAFNMSALRRIGYMLKAGYVIKESYGSMTAYLDEEIFSKDVVDLSIFDRRLLNLSSFVSALEKKRNSLEFIENAPRIFVSIQKVQEVYGLDQEDIRQIQQMLLPYYNTPYFNAHSLWEKVKDLPLIQQLQGNEWMLSSIMRQQENVFARHFAGNIILSLDSENINLNKIALWFCSIYGKMPLNAFVAKFNDYFGCTIENYKFAAKLRSANVWDEIVTDSMDEYMDALLDFSKMSDEDLFAEEFM